MTRAGVCLSGCGVFDGSEIHEAVVTLLALDRAGCEIVCMAPDVPFAVIDHRTGEPSGETRNVLTEAARIARGQIVDVAQVSASEIDCLFFPGGFGAAKNLCDFAVSGAAVRVQPDVEQLVRGMLDAKKPIGAICIAPTLIAAVLRDTGRAGELTIGTDAETGAAVEALAGKHVPCPVEGFHVDEANAIVSTPAYMLAERVSEITAGIERLVDEVLARCPSSSRT